jgi:hypothetical protein
VETQQYAILLAVRNKLVKYVKAKHDQENLGAADFEGQPLINNHRSASQFITSSLRICILHSIPLYVDASVNARTERYKQQKINPPLLFRTADHSVHRTFIFSSLPNPPRSSIPIF